MKWPLVQIEWWDSSSFDAWTDLEQIGEAKILRVVSVGWLVGESKDALALAASIAHQDGKPTNACGDIAIPRVAIIKRRTLVRAKGKSE